MADHREFGLRLKQACDRSSDVPEFGKGQQTWIAERLSVSQEAVRRYFEGESRPRPKRMSQLAKILNVDESWLALGKSTGLSDKERRHYNQKAEASAYMMFGVFMAAGYTCAFAEDEDGVDFYAIRTGKQIPVVVTTAIVKTKNTFVVPVKDNSTRLLNLCVIPSEQGLYDVIIMDHNGVEKYGEFTTDMLDVPVRRGKQGYHTEHHIWTELKDSEIL